MPYRITDSVRQMHAIATANLGPDEPTMCSRDVETLLGVDRAELTNRRNQKLVIHILGPVAGQPGAHALYPTRFVRSLQAFLGQRKSNWGLWLLHLIHYTRCVIQESDYQLLKRLCQELTRSGVLMRATEARDTLGLSSNHFKSWMEREFLATARLSRSTVYFASNHIHEQAKILTLRNVKEAAGYLGISPEGMRSYSNRGRVAYVLDASGHKHFTAENLAVLKKSLDEDHFVRSQEAAGRLGVQPKTIVKYYHRGLLQGMWPKKSVLVFPESEIKRAEQELSRYVVCAGFEWLEAFLAVSKLEVRYLTVKQVARTLGSRSVVTLAEWKAAGIIPFCIQEFFVGYSCPPAIFYPEIYFQRLKTFARQRPLNRRLAAEFRDQCAQRGRLPLA